MSKPTLEAHAGIYSLHWAEHGIKAQVERFSEDRRGVVTAEVEILCLFGNEWKPLHKDARLTLTSTNSRLGLAKHLGTRVEKEWDDIVEQLCVFALEAYRQGEPMVMVGSLPPSSGPEYRLYPILQEKQPTLIYGPGGSGKSRLGAFFSLLVQTGQKAVGLESVQGNVLILDWETCAEEMDDILNELKEGMLLNCPDIAYRYCSQPLASEILEIQKMSKELDAKLVIVDSAGMALGGEPESAEIVLRMFAALRSLETTVLIFDHIAKDSKNPSPFGSVYKTNSARSVFEIRKEQEAGSHEMTVALYHRKINRGTLQRPLGFRVQFEPDACFITESDVRSSPGLAAGLPIADQIEGILREGVMVVKELSESLNLPENTLRAILSRYKHRFVKVGTGWGLRSFE